LGRSSSPPPRAGCSAICFICATSVCTRSRGLRRRLRRGRSRAYPIPRAASRRSARRGWPLSSALAGGTKSCLDSQAPPRTGKGEGQIVLIWGEPGIGKSRLAAALAERIASEPHTRLRYQCSPYHTNSALRPFIAQLERAAGSKADDTSEQRLDKLEAVLAMS